MRPRLGPRPSPREAGVRDPRRQGGRASRQPLPRQPGLRGGRGGDDSSFEPVRALCGVVSDLGQPVRDVAGHRAHHLALGPALAPGPRHGHSAYGQHGRRRRCARRAGRAAGHGLHVARRLPRRRRRQRDPQRARPPLPSRLAGRLWPLRWRRAVGQVDRGGQGRADAPLRLHLPPVGRPAAAPPRRHPRPARHAAQPAARGHARVFPALLGALPRPRALRGRRPHFVRAGGRRRRQGVSRLRRLRRGLPGGRVGVHPVSPRRRLLHVRRRLAQGGRRPLVPCAPRPTHSPSLPRTSCTPPSARARWWPPSSSSTSPPSCCGRAASPWT